MKKITLLLLFSLFSLVGFAQLTPAVEGFENTSGPTALPSTNWTLDSGNWTVWDNGVGTVNRWGINNTVSTPPQVYQGTNSAYVRAESIGNGNTSKDWLVSPPVTIPANGEMHFFTRSFTSGNQGCIYKVKVAFSSSSPTDESAYFDAQQWSETDLTTTFNIYEEKVVDLSAFEGLEVYVAFVLEFTQVGAFNGGDRWLIDNVNINSQCFTPTTLTSSAVVYNGATLNWANPSGATSWEVEIVPSTGTPTGTGTVYNGTLPYVVTGLTPNTTYTFLVRALCSSGFSSPWSVASTSFTTPIAPPICGGNFVDSGGISANYPNNANQTTLICPQTAGDLVTVAFTSFNTEATNDVLKIYSGDSAGTGTLLGSYSGTTLPPTFTSGAPSGCLTFVFTSNATVTAPGWIANVTCAPAPACQQPLVLTAGTATSSTIPLSWTNAGSATSWQVLALPCGSPAPTSTTTGWVNAGTNPFTLTGLASATCYTIYVRSNCGTNGVSTWSFPINVTTDAAPLQCGGNYVDLGGLNGNYSNNANDIRTVCPTAGNVVTVTFTSFATEPNNDVLKIYNGTGTAGTLLGTFSGTTLPPSITSSAADGCLTFVFTSNATVTAAGWVANITCGPPPACPKPVALTASGTSATSVSLGWTAVGSATSWQVLALPCTDPAPTSSTTGWTETTLNPYPFTGLNTGTCYNFYVRSNCGGVTGTSEWTGPQAFTTAVPGFTCAAPIVVGTLPYTTTNDTANFSDNPAIEGSPGATGCGSTNGYLNGNDVVYSFTPTFTGTINVAMTPTATYSGIFAYSSCANIGVSCLAGVANSGTGVRSFDLPVTAGSTYYFVISTWATPQTTGYTLVINQINCSQPTLPLVGTITATTANLSWTSPASTSWQVAVQPAGTGIPTGAGITATNPYTATGLTPLTNYEYYVRADCGNGTFSLWTGPVAFTTAAPPPACGGNFYDTGGPNGTYQNSEDSTVVICPTVGSSNVVTVTFSQFVTEANWDGLYVFDGPTITSPQLASANGPGNGQLTLAGAYWGTLTGANLPGPFTSTDPSGCLTFRFRSDGSGNNFAGWAASVTCSPAPNCARPTALTATNITSTSALLGWAEPTTAVTQWEIYYVLAGSPVPLPTTTGTIVSQNPVLLTGLNPGTQYTFYVRSLCPTGGTSAWSLGGNFTTLIINDNCSGAIFAPVNTSTICQQITPGTLTGATASTPAPTAPCVGTANDDVWFQFVASNPYLNISLQDITGTTTNLNFGVYSGQCGTLTQVFCSAAGTTTGVANNLTIGQTYYIRVYSNGSTSQTVNFNLCISTPSTCTTSNTICNLLGENTPSTLGITSLGTIGCLLSSPCPTFYTLDVATTGPINLFLSQSSLPNGQGVPRDIDYAAWGPFTSQAQACGVVGNQAPYAAPGIGVPVTPTTGCSFSAAATETLNIANAQAGQIYIILITNYSQQAGFINLTQTNFGQPGAGTVNCCPDAYFTYNPVSYCKIPGAPNPVATITTGSVAGTFSLSPSSPTGLVFANTATGEVDLAASAPGNYLVLNTVAPTTNCEQKQRGYNISIVLPTSATISYSAPSYCKNIDTPQPVTFSGTTGGVYSASPLGLSIDVATGAITPSLSAPGTYTVTYGIPGVSVCSLGNPQTTVEILATPNIPQPAAVTACNSYTLTAPTVGNYYAQPGGVGTPLDITVPLTSTQTVYIYAINASGCYDEKSFTVTINTVPTPTYTVTSSSCTNPTGSITVTSPVSQSGTIPSNIFISAVTDAGNTAPLAYRSLTYVVLYNATGNTVNLANYKLKVYNNGSSTLSANNNLTLSGSMPNNSAKIIAIGSANNPATGISPNLTFATCSGVNNNDNIRLTTSTDVVVDNWGTTDGSVFTPSGQVGYTYRRNSNATPLPSITWNPADWTAVLPEDYTNLSSYSSTVSNYQYSLDNGSFQSGLTFSNLAGGDHILIVKDLTTNCTSTPVTINVDAAGGGTITSLTPATPICSGGNAVFTIVATPNATVTYTINNGATQTVVLDATGNATVTVNAVTANTTILLTQISTTSCNTTISNTATVQVLSNVTFGTLASNTPICSGANAVFTLTGTPNATVTYSINNGANQTVVLDGTGTGTVTINSATADTTILLSDITLGTCNSTLSNSEIVAVLPNPVFGTLTAATPICSGGDAVFTLSGTPNATVTYTINSGTSQTLVLDTAGNATVTVNAVAANTTIQLSQISLGTCNSTLTNSATVVVLSNPVFGTLTATTPVCSGGNAVFTLTGTANATVSYAINNGTTQSVVLDATGNATVAVNAVTTDTTILLSQISLGTSCSATLTNSATVVVLPNPTFGTLTATTPVCSGANAVFTLTGTANATVTYSINSGSNQTVVLNATGNGTVTITGVTTNTTILLSQISIGACSAVITNTATVTVLPNPTFGTLTATTPICSGGNAVFTLSGTANATVAYTINSGAAQTLILNASGNGTVIVTGVTADTTMVLSQISLGTCSTVITNTATVTVLPNPTFGTLVATTPICSGGDAVFTLTGTANATVAYTVNNGATQTVVLNATGNATITVTGVTADTTMVLSQISIGTCSTTITNTATVAISLPVQILLTGGCQGQFYNLTASPVSNSFNPQTVSYAWYNNLGVVIGSTQTIVVTQTGNYYVVITNGGCTSQSTPFTVDSTTCVIQRGISADNDGLNDNFDLSGYNVKTLTIFNRYGMKVYTKDNYSKEWIGQSDKGDELPDGTYYYVIERTSGENVTGWIYINRVK